MVFLLDFLLEERRVALIKPSKINGLRELMERVFLASINPDSAELNFPNTPFPLLGFHG